MLSLRKRHQREPTLSDLSYFIEEESALVNDPLFFNSAVDECLEEAVKPDRRSLKINLAGVKKDRNRKKECQMCQKNHDMMLASNTNNFKLRRGKSF